MENSFNHKFVVFPIPRPDCLQASLLQNRKGPFPLWSVSTSNKIKIKMSTFTCTSGISPNRDKINIMHFSINFIHLNVHLPICDSHPYLYSKIVSKMKQTTISIPSQYSLSPRAKYIIYLFSKKN